MPRNIVLYTSYISLRNLELPQCSLRRTLPRTDIKLPTSQTPTLLQMIDTLPSITFPQFLPYQPSHHALDPLFPNDRILRCLQPWRI